MLIIVVDDLTANMLSLQCHKILLSFIIASSE